MSVAIPNINHHIYQYQQDGVQFNLLSLCRSPLCSVPEMIAENVHAIALIKLLLSNIEPNWQQFSEINESTLVGGPVNPFGVSQELLQNSSLSEVARQRLQEAGTNVSVLINLYQEWARDQIQLQVSYMDEVALIGQENEQARRRKHDYTSIIYNSLKTLSKQGILKEIVNEVCDKGAIMQ
jgi:ubiquitin carboxyl-terminal hydrolase L5